MKPIKADDRNLDTEYPVTKKVLAAEKKLRKRYPQVYRFLVSFKNAGNIPWEELEKIKFHIEVAGVKWEKVRGIVNAFIGKRNKPAPVRKEVSTIMPEKPPKLKHDYKRSAKYPLTKEQREAIAKDTRAPRFIAADFNIPVKMIYILRHEEMVKRKSREVAT